MKPITLKRSNTPKSLHPSYNGFLKKQFCLSFSHTKGGKTPQNQQDHIKTMPWCSFQEKIHKLYEPSKIYFCEFQYFTSGKLCDKLNVNKTRGVGKILGKHNVIGFQNPTRSCQHYAWIFVEEQTNKNFTNQSCLKSTCQFSDVTPCKLWQDVRGVRAWSRTRNFRTQPH